jgi:hypothetical protein
MNLDVVSCNNAQRCRGARCRTSARQARTMRWLLDSCGFCLYPPFRIHLRRRQRRARTRRACDGQGWRRAARTGWTHADRRTTVRAAPSDCAQTPAHDAASAPVTRDPQARRTHIAYRADHKPAFERVRARARVLVVREGVRAREADDVRAQLGQAQPVRARQDMQALEAPVRAVEVRQVWCGARRQTAGAAGAGAAPRGEPEWQDCGGVKKYTCARGEENARRRAPRGLLVTGATCTSTDEPSADSRPAEGGL